MGVLWSTWWLVVGAGVAEVTTMTLAVVVAVVVSGTDLQS
jgi:hypothetical protein